MSHCPPLSNIDDPKLACYQHCRNAVAPYVAPHRWTPLRPADFQDCMQNCRECVASRGLWHNCVEYNLAADPTYTALADRVADHGCPECRKIMRAIEHHYMGQCASYR